MTETQANKLTSEPDVSFTSSDIFMAAAKGHLKKLKSIYKQDPTIIYHRDENGFVPLHIAALHSKLEVLKFMIDKEVESKKNKEPAEVNVAPKPALVTVRSQHGWTPLLLAISAPKQTKADALNAHKCVEFLLENGADSNTANDDGSSACHIATLENMPDVLRLLMKYHADVSTADKKGKKPIDLARKKGHKECARALLAGEWGTSDEYFHSEVTKLMHLKRYRDELRRELDIITLFESDIERTLSFKEWLQSKGYKNDDDSKDGPPKLLSDKFDPGNIVVKKQEVEKTQQTVFGRANRNKSSGKSSKSSEILNPPPFSAPPKHASSICNVCSGPISEVKREKEMKNREENAQVELPNLRSSLIESVLFGSSVKESRPPATRFFKGTSMLDHKKRRSWNSNVSSSNNRLEMSQSANPFHSSVGSILREDPPPMSYFDKPQSKKSDLSVLKESDTLLNNAAKVPIMWKGKPATVKDYLLEKSFIC